MLSDEGMLSQVKAVEQKLHVQSSEQINETLTNEELKAAAEMFLYLNTCPDVWFKDWFSFYSDFFLNQPADQIILALNRMTKIASPQNNNGKLRAEKLLLRTARLLSLKYEEIQSFLQKKEIAFESIKSQNWNIPKGAHLDIFV